VPTLASVLGAHGYRTHAVVTNPFLAARYGVDAGFCSFENVTMAGEAVRGMRQTTLVRLVRVLAPARLPSDRASTVGAHAARWLAAEGDRPFFLWLHILDPHAPYGDRDGASTSLVLDLMAFQESSGPEAPFRATGRLRAGEYRPDAAERRRIASLYRQDVAFADREIERLLDDLAGRGLLGRTAVVFTADHGEEFWDHGGVEHGRTLYEEVLHVPLVVVPAGGAPPAVRRTSPA
jgi:arylsulfatase